MQTGGSGTAPMDVDPIDDGPADKGSRAPPVPVYGRSIVPAHMLLQQQPVTEEDARQCIEMLRSDDISSRVAAAYRLDAVALALGIDRTHDVRTLL